MVLVVGDEVAGKTNSAAVEVERLFGIGDTYASCKKVRPRVYWESFAALTSGK